jgi:hypothetical protein
MSDELLQMAQSLGCSPTFVEFEMLPVTYSQIVLVAGLIITDSHQQTGPNYDANQRTRYDLCTEVGDNGLAIIFNNHNGGTTGEIVFDAPKFRRSSRHIINAQIEMSPGDFRPMVRDRRATLSIGDMGLIISSTDDNEMLQKYGQRAVRRYGYRNYNNRSHFTSLGFNINCNQGIQIQYSWNKNEHVYGWNNNAGHARTTVIPFFGTEKPTRIKPVFETKFPYDTFKKMLNSSGRAKDSGGALYWSYNPKTKKMYTVGAYADGEISKEGRTYNTSAWVHNSVTKLIAGTIPYRPFGEAIVNRYKTATHAGFGMDAHGRQYICIYYPWGHIRYNHITFSHGVIEDESVSDISGPKVSLEKNAPAFFENYDLSFEYSPYTASEELFLNKWYAVFNEYQEEQLSRPKLPKKGEILQWYICFCQNGDVTDEDALLAQKILS